MFDGTRMTITLLKVCTLMDSAWISVTGGYSRKVVELSVIFITMKNEMVSTALVSLKTFQNVDQKYAFPGGLKEVKIKLYVQRGFSAKMLLRIFLLSTVNLNYLRTNLPQNYVKGSKRLHYDLLNLLL